MTQQAALRRDDISEFISKMYEGDLHAKRVLSLSNATLGVLTSASLAIHAVGQGLAQAMGTLSKHGVKQVDRLLSNDGIDVERFFGYWVPYMVGARPEMVVALDWTSFARDGHETIVLELPRFSGHLQTVQRRCSQWQRLIHRTRRSSGARWSSWSARAVRRGSWPASSGAVRRRSATGSVRAIATKGVVMTV